MRTEKEKRRNEGKKRCKEEGKEKEGSEIEKKKEREGKLEE